MPLDGGNAQVQAIRQVHDLPEPRPLEVTEHRVHACECDRCGSRTVAGFPGGVDASVHFGDWLFKVNVQAVGPESVDEKAVQQRVNFFVSWFARQFGG